VSGIFAHDGAANIAHVNDSFKRPMGLQMIRAAIVLVITKLRVLERQLNVTFLLMATL